MLALRDQVRIRLLECISWPKGAFSLDAGSPPSDAANPFRIDVYDVLQAGIEAHWRADQVLGDLEPKIERFASKNDRFSSIFERLESDDALAAFVQALDGTRAFWDTLKLATSPRSLAAAWVLDAAGALDYSLESDAADSKTPAEVEIFVHRQRKQPNRNSPRRTKALRTWTRSRSNPKLRLRFAARSRRGSKNSTIWTTTSCSASTLMQKPTQSRLPISRPQSAITPTHSQRPASIRKRGSRPTTYSRESAKPTRSFRTNGSAPNTTKPNARDEGPIDAARLANAESLYRKGEVLLRSGNFAGALEFLRPAVELWPDESDYCSALGWALYRKLPSEPVLAREQLERAVELSPQNATAIHRLSITVRSMGEGEKADSLLGRARSIDPKIG